MKPRPFHLLTPRRTFIRNAVYAALGSTACWRDMHLISSALAQAPFTDYKALVCVFLDGGSDSHNMIIPTLAAEYDDYESRRSSVLAIPNTDGGPATAQALSPLSADGHDYGMHPALFELAKMFNQSAGYTGLGQVAIQLNMGTLVYPMTKAQFSAGSVARPPQLFSHSDQVTQWQTSIPDLPPNNGWGGRMADILHSYNPQEAGLDVLPTCITLVGANTFQVGASVQEYAVGTNGIVALVNPSNPSTAAAARQNTLNTIIGLQKSQPNLFTSNYAGALDHSIATGGALSAALSSSQMPSYWTTAANWSKNATLDQIITPNGGSTFKSSLMAQLRMVARIIEAGYRQSGVSNGLGMKRQIFFVKIGGFDTHTNQTTAGNPILGNHANLLADVSQSIHSFQRALVAIGTQYGDVNFVNRVTAFTASDFGRTLTSNGGGSDHGWGTHSIVIGGAVAGQRTYGKFPTLSINGTDDAGSGRLIPTTAVDQYAATLAKWMGVTPSNMATVFPNLSRFATPDLGFMT